MCQHHVFAEHRWQRLAEAIINDYESRYVLLRQDGKLCAAAVCSIERHFYSRLLETMAGPLLRVFPCMRCVLPLAANSGIIVHPDYTQCLPVLLDAVHELARRERISFYTIDNLYDNDPTWAHLQDRGYHRMPMLEEIYLDIEWPTFDEYLATLPKKKRNEYRRTGRALEAQGIEMRVIHPTPENQPHLTQLVNNVFVHHNEPVTYREDFPLRAQDIMDGNMCFYGAYQGDDIIACAAFLRSGGAGSLKCMGLAYERTMDTGAYYQIVAEGIRQAIEWKVSRLYIGATAYQTKRHFAPVRETRDGAMMVCNRPLHWMLGQILRRRRVHYD
ncbi:MAG: GNAT family N-acetyltransferase [Anaerolineae bacterium]|nr:GNAT family N-acetyltransferase [Anaerolineae bacterium]